jgi:hypothetical protein
VPPLSLNVSKILFLQQALLKEFDSEVFTPIREQPDARPRASAQPSGCPDAGRSSAGISEWVLQRVGAMKGREHAAALVGAWHASAHLLVRRSCLSNGSVPVAVSGACGARLGALAGAAPPAAGQAAARAAQQAGQAAAAAARQAAEAPHPQAAQADAERGDHAHRAQRYVQPGLLGGRGRHASAARACTPGLFGMRERGSAALVKAPRARSKCARYTGMQ